MYFLREVSFQHLVKFSRQLIKKQLHRFSVRCVKSKTYVAVAKYVMQRRSRQHPTTMMDVPMQFIRSMRHPTSRPMSKHMQGHTIKATSTHGLCKAYYHGDIPQPRPMSKPMQGIRSRQHRPTAYARHTIKATSHSIDPCKEYDQGNIDPRPMQGILSRRHPTA